MAKVTAYVPEPVETYQVNNQRQIIESINTIKDQLNFGYQQDLKNELEAFIWFLFSGPKN